MTARVSNVRIDVIVASYRRPESLIRCLNALGRQSVAPARVIVVARNDDTETHDAACAVPAVELHFVDEPGVIAAMSAGIAVSTASVVAFTDDDAMPHSDWIERLAAAFVDPTIGAVGGRDLIPGADDALTVHVGRWRRFGRLDGNHHIGTGPARDVDVLKGVNLAVRADVLAMPARGVLVGDGAQPHWEVLTCARVATSGLRVIFDPAILVDHDCAVRRAGPHRDSSDWAAVRELSFNGIVSATALRVRSLPARLAYALVVGSSDRPGFARLLVALVRREHGVARKLPPSIVGATQAGTSVLFALHGRRGVSAIVTASALRDASGRRL